MPLPRLIQRSTFCLSRKVFPRIFVVGVPPGSSSPDPVSDWKMLFSTTVLTPGLLNPIPFSDMVWVEIKSSFLDNRSNKKISSSFLDKHSNKKIS